MWRRCAELFSGLAPILIHISTLGDRDADAEGARGSKRPCRFGADLPVPASGSMALILHTPLIRSGQAGLTERSFMFNKIDLRELAQISGPERAFVSLYLAAPESLNGLKGRLDTIRALLSESPAEAEHFEENLKLVETWLAEHTWTSEGLCLFVCWALDFVRAHPLSVAVPDMIWVDSSPYIRPLAELQDEYENFAVVAADNSASRIFFVTSARPDEDARIKGDIKNNVKKGGWSQKRYE